MKKLTVFILAALMAITCVSTALAANWVEIDRNNEFICSIDVSSVRQTGNIFRMWHKIILRTPQKQAEYKKGLRSSKTPAYFVQYVEYKIDEPAYRVISSACYAKDSTVADSSNVYSEWRMIPPDSRGEIMWHIGRRILGLE